MESVKPTRPSLSLYIFMSLFPPSFLYEKTKTAKMIIIFQTSLHTFMSGCFLFYALVFISKNFAIFADGGVLHFSKVNEENQKLRILNQWENLVST